MIIIKDGTPSFKVTVPPEDMCIGYDGENMVRRIVFSPPAGYDGWTWRVDLILADGGDDVVLLQLDGDVLAWDILDKHLVCPDGAGKVKAQIRANNPATPLQTKKSNWFTLYTQSSIDAIDKICVSPSEIAQAEKYMDALLLDGQTARAAAEEAAATAGVAKQEAIRQAELAGDAATGAAAAEQEAAKERAAAEEAAKQTAADRLVTGQDRAEVERLTGQVRADREQVGKDREAVAGDKAAAETAKTGAEAAEAEVIKQAGIATDQVALATEQAERAKAEADRAAGIDAYTKGDADSRYLRATEIRRPFADGVITLADADDAAFGGVTVLGATTEAGTGDKGPDNPYALTGVQPASLTVCGKNLCPPTFYQGAYTTQAESRIRSEIIPIVPHVQYVFSVAAGYAALNVYFLGANKVGLGWLQSANNTAAQLRFTPNKDTYRYAVLVVSYPDQTTPIAPDAPISAQLEFGTAATPYTSYAGQTIDLPVLAPLYGDGTVCDEYDAATGVETRRWGRVEFDGTEAWITRTSGAGVYGYALPDVFDAPAAAGVCTHFSFVKNGASGMQTAVCVASASTRKDLSVFTTIATLDDFKAWLSARATAGTPVTVVYQLAEPVVTQHGPQRIHTYPGCTNLMLDISAEGAVRYPLSAPMQWDAKADKTAADDRYGGVLTGTASGAVAALEDVSPTGALRRTAVLGATAETGEGDKCPDNPYTLAGVQPTKVTVCGKNLLPVTRSTPVTQGGITLTPLENGLLKLSGTCTANNNCPVFCTQPVRLDGTLTATVTVQSGTAEFVGYNLVQYNGDIQGLTLVNMKTKEHHFQRTCMASGFNIRMDAGTVFNDYVFGIQLEKGDTATPYEPYTGQTITLPALEPLYGDGTVNDEYDAVSGVETRRWKRVVFDGTESMRCEAHGNGQRYVSIDLDAAANKSVMPISTHYTSSAWTQDNNKVYIPNPVVMVITDSRFTTLQAARDILAAQYAAGTPVTVVYQLDEPVITQHDPARILPPAPVCRVFADAGSTAVGYNRDVNSLAAELEDLKATIAALLGGGA